MGEMFQRVDVLVVGAGPGGSTAARVAAAEGLRVLLVEQRPCVGLPVQCAEYVPAQIVAYAPLPERCIAQRIRALRTHLPDGEVVETPSAGYVLDRALFDKALAVAACRAGAEVWTAARALEWDSDQGPGAGGQEAGSTEHVIRNTKHKAGIRVKVRRGTRTEEIACRVLIGADGPRSTVGRWIGQVNTEFIDARQVEVVLPALPSPSSQPPPSLAWREREGVPTARWAGVGEGRLSTEVYFDPAYRGGYGWLFPKGETANVGVGVSRSMGGDPRQALAHLLERLEIGRGAIVGRTGGPVPSGGPVARVRVGEVLLVGDAAGHTHPITGAGIFAAVVGGTLAGQAAAQAIKTGDLTALDEYEREGEAFMGGPLRHALNKRRCLDRHWSDDPAVLSGVIRETWIAFKEYGRRKRR